jgi:HEAT repeat protein
MALGPPFDALVRRMATRGFRRQITAELAALAERDVRTPEGFARIALAHDEELELRLAAIWMLGRLERDAASVNAALMLLADAVTDATQHIDVRCAAADALAFWEDDRAVPALPAVVTPAADTELRCNALFALGMRAPGSFVDDLVALVRDDEDDPRVRGRAAEALGHLFQLRRVPRAVDEAIRTVVAHPDDELRWDAVFALGCVGRVRDIPLLERLLADELARAEASALVVSAAEDALEGLRARRRPRA